MGAAEVSALVRKLHAKRERWLQVAPGLELLVRRPAEVELAKLRQGIEFEDAVAAITGWRGFTEAVLLGDPALGDSETALPFSADLCAEWLRDNVAAVNAVVDDMAQRVREHIEARVAARGN